MQTARQLMFGNPLSRALVFGLLALSGNVAAGGYVFEITRSDANGHQFLSWNDSIACPSFWALWGILALMVLYGVGVARYDRRLNKRVTKALTDAEIRARAFEILVDPLLEAVKKDVEQGKLWSMDEVFEKLSIDRKSKP